MEDHINCDLINERSITVFLPIVFDFSATYILLPNNISITIPDINHNETEHAIRYKNQLI